MRITFTWRLFPYAIALMLAGVAMIDGTIAWTALRTFPGVVTHSQFTDSNRYDAVLANAAREAALGWTADFALAGGAVRLTLTDRDGRKLEGARISGQALRPLGAPETQMLSFHAVAPGDYVADRMLTGAGQWEVAATVSIAGKSLHVARRLRLP